MAVSQAHVLRAHDEIKMATSRLRLREDEDDKSIEALSPEELDMSSVENSGEKFLALDALSRIKGQLRYLKVATEPCFLAAYWFFLLVPTLMINFLKQNCCVYDFLTNISKHQILNNTMGRGPT